MKGFIIIGVSGGIGKSIFNKLSNDYFTIGITSKNNIKHENFFFYSLSDKLSNQKKSLDKINSELKKYKDYDFTILFNSTIYDKKDDTLADKNKILEVNFFNQISLFKYLENTIKINISKIVFFSSFEALKKQSKMRYYRLSKILYLDEYFYIIKNNKKLIVKLFMLGGIKTESYFKNSKITNNIILKHLPKDLDKASNYIISKIKSDKSEIIYYPKSYYFLYLMNRILKK